MKPTLYYMQFNVLTYKTNKFVIFTYKANLLSYKVRHFNMKPILYYMKFTILTYESNHLLYKVHHLSYETNPLLYKVDHITHEINPLSYRVHHLIYYETVPLSAPFNVSSRRPIILYTI